MRYASYFMQYRAEINKLVATAMAGLALLTVMSVPLVSAPASTAPPHARLTAVYAIHFAGIKLGKFTVWSNLGRGSYSMRSQGSLKFITGLLFEIKGGTTTTGAVTGNGPRPRSFTFAFKTKKHKGDLAMMFENGAVTHVMAKPPFAKSATIIPVTEAHVKGVLDPMSAIFFSARADGNAAGASVCPGRIPVFDGRQRFDLLLSYKKTIQVKKRRLRGKIGKGGYRGTAIVCRIKYIPIAGYTPDNSGIKFMAASDDIEVWLIKVPRKSMYVPYYVKVPTPFGTATITSTAFYMEIPGEKKIAIIR